MPRPATPTPCVLHNSAKNADVFTQVRDDDDVYTIARAMVCNTPSPVQVQTAVDSRASRLSEHATPYSAEGHTQAAASSKPCCLHAHGTTAVAQTIAPSACADRLRDGDWDTAVRWSSSNTRSARATVTSHAAHHAARHHRRHWSGCAASCPGKPAAPSATGMPRRVPSRRTATLQAMLLAEAADGRLAHQHLCSVRACRPHVHSTHRCWQRQPQCCVPAGWMQAPAWTWLLQPHGRHAAMTTLGMADRRTMLRRPTNATCHVCRCAGRVRHCAKLQAARFCLHPASTAA